MNGPFVSTAIHSLIMGNANLTSASLSSLTTSINGTNTLKLSGNGITIGTGTSTLGFFGQSPTIPKPTGVATTAAGIHAALVSLGLIAP